MNGDYLIIDNEKALITTLDLEKVPFDFNLEHYLEKLCLAYGSSLEGRLKAMAYLGNSQYKLPLVISDKEEIYYLRTRNFKEKDCILLNYREFSKYKIAGKNTEIIFKGGYRYLLPCDYRIIKRQVFILEQYLNIYRNIQHTKRSDLFA